MKKDAARPVVGAIRWDAWFGDRGVPGKAVEKSLGPRKWHYRLPFYGKEISDDKVEVRGDTQETMDREIAYAAGAGLDYFAFVTYAEGDAMSLGLKQYLASAKKSKIRFCLNLQGGHLTAGSPEAWPQHVKRYVEYFKDAQYQKVTGGRPLVFLFSAGDLIGPKKFSDWKAARNAFDGLRKASKDAGAGDPYIAVQVWSPANDKQEMEKLGCDALSAYAVTGGNEGTPVPFADLRKQARAFWEDCRKAGAQAVPLASAGWDRRPRFDNPVPWEGVAGSAACFAAPKPDELGAHVGEAVDWVRAHPKDAEAQAVLIYAWNEIDEGGWLVPTLAEGAARLDAIKEALSKR